MKTCSVEGCGREHSARGLCVSHYCQKHKAGLLEGLPYYRPANGEGKGYLCRRAGGKREHVVVAERALGHPLPLDAEVHHINGNRRDNRPENLVICPDKAYHRMLHVRERAFNACGHADWKPCRVCKQYDSPENLVSYPTAWKGKPYTYRAHRECHSAYHREYRAKRKGAGNGTQ